MKSTLKYHNGFTIVELMLTLAVAAILATLAAPSFTSLIQNNRLTTQINELTASLSLARSEAITRGIDTTVCMRLNDTTCGGSWGNGWIVFINDDNDGTIDAGEEIIRVHDALNGNNLTFGAGINRITYRETGLAGQANTFVLCDDRGATSAKAIVLNNTGRPRLAQDTGGDGIVEKGGNVNVTCP